MRTATFALFMGIAYLSAGVLGMVPEARMPPEGHLLGLFPVNTAHNVVHLLIGGWGVAAWQADHIGQHVRSPRLYAQAVAILYGLLALLGVIPATNTLFGLVPLHGNDVWLHGASAATAAYFGWRQKSEVERRGGPVTDRREHALPVERERRLGHGDRRVPGSEV